jgi:hypothetical protein
MSQLLNRLNSRSINQATPIKTRGALTVCESLHLMNSPHPSQYPGLLTGDPVTEVGLFDLENDPGEQHNLAEKYPEIVQKLSALADGVRKEMQEEARQRMRPH